MSSDWSGRKVMAARAVVAKWLPAPCGQCGKEVAAEDVWVVGHKIARSIRPDLTWSVSNWQPEHKACSDASAQSVVIEKAKAEALAQAGVSSPTGPSRQSPLLPFSLSQGRGKPYGIRSELTWAHHTQAPPTWLLPYIAVPADASPPLAMSPPHPEAVDSYGLEAIVWIESHLNIKLRWWQQLAIVRQLECRADGSLCWRTILESAPRRSGKSWRLRGMALWRMSHDFGERQLVLHCGQNLRICREVQKDAWRFAEDVMGWKVTRGNGKEAIEDLDDGHRWVVAAQDAVYGFDVTLGIVDEAWDVSPTAVDEGLEPATIERIWPQMLLTSTAHRRATSLMRKRLSAALAQDDGDTLLLLWGAEPDADFSDPDVWRAASPWWSDDRAKLVEAKYAAALASEADPELDDPDPIMGFASQYLNVWRLNDPPLIKGDPITSAETWELLAEEMPDENPTTVAIESWFDGGVSVGYAWKSGLVHAEDFPDLATAGAVLKADGITRLIVGASLADDPALKGFRITKGTGRTAGVVQDLSRLLQDGTLRHSGGAHLTEQVLAVRTTPASDGIRLLSKERADAIKAVVWALNAARKPSVGKPRILLPTAS